MSKLFKSAVLGLSLSLGFISYSAFAHVEETREVSENCKDIIVTREIKEKGDRFELNLKYPKVKLENKEVQKKINKVIKRQVNDFKKYIKDMYNDAMSNTPKELIENSASFDYKGITDFDCEVVGNVLSIRMSLIQFTGGAHPMTYVKEFNFDLNTGEVLKLEDLFNEEGKNTYKDIVNKFIKDKMNENPDNYFIDQFKGIGDNVQFYLTESNVVVFYQLYDLAPYSAGIPEFYIPYELFGETISTNLKK